MATEDLMKRAIDALGNDDQPISVDVIHQVVDAGTITGPLSIAATADLLDITPHTLRYYERAGLVDVGRDASGYRLYDAETVRRLIFIAWMRLSGMPMRELQRYVELVDQGEETVPERLAMLVAHRKTIQRQVLELRLSLAATEYKIATYGGETGPDQVGTSSASGSAV